MQKASGLGALILGGEIYDIILNCADANESNLFLNYFISNKI
jgi:hypothetical protein